MNKLKGIIYDCILWLIIHGKRKKPFVKKMLIIRVDEIGDYMLWHKFLEEIVSAERFKGYEVHFCGNQSWKSLFDSFDAKWVSHTYWFNKIRFKKEMRYRHSFLKQIYLQHYDVVINPTYSRDKRNDDCILMAAKAPISFGMVANQENVRSYETGYDRNLYAHEFNFPEKPIFEFYRNRLFTEFVTQSISQITNTRINTELLPVLSVELPEKYFVVFPGSRSSKRIWPAENFVMAANYLFDTHGWTVVVAGTKTDEVYTGAFCDQYSHPLINLTGKTSLTEMLSVLSKAQCLLSVDTGSVHLATATGCPVYGIFNGSQYKRFAPYPKELAPGFHAIYPDDIEIDLQDDKLVREKYEFVVDVPYASVRPEKMILAMADV